MKRHATQTLSRRMVLSGLLASAASPLLAQDALTVLRPVLRGKAAVPDVSDLVDAARISGDVVFALADAATGEILEARGPGLGVAPASVTKAITALYALDTLGADHRFSTQLLATGPMVDGVLQGHLVLAGGCDPSMDTRDLAALAAQLKETGLREVRDGFIVYDGPILSIRNIDPEQPDHLGYNPAVAGIALNYNRVHFEWKRQNTDYNVTMDARSGKYRPAVDVARMKIVERSAPVYTYEDAFNTDNWTVARGALGREGARWLPVRRPGLYAGDVFRTLARAHGIVLKPAAVTNVRPEGHVLTRIQSDPLIDILKGMLKYSTNLTAETVGLASTHERVGYVDTLAKSAAEMNAWARDVLGMSAPGFADHSGLGSASRISAGDMVKGLGAVGRVDALRPILKPVALRDQNGQPVKNHPVKADAKTGTLNFVSGLAGYVTATNGREMVFAYFSADEAIRATITRAQRERPRGARTWANRSRRLQRQLLERWGVVYAEEDFALED